MMCGRTLKGDKNVKIWKTKNAKRKIKDIMSEHIKKVKIKTRKRQKQEDSFLNIYVKKTFKR